MEWFEAIGFVLVGSRCRNFAQKGSITATECVIIRANKLTSATHHVWRKFSVWKNLLCLSEGQNALLRRKAMKPNNTFTKKDLVVALCCVVFLLINLGAIGSNSRKQAEASTCRSNLKQWGLIFAMYCSDNNGYFTKGYIGAATTKNDMWMGALRPYYRNDPNMRCCPVATKTVSEGGRNPFSAWGIFDGKGWTTKGDYGSYGINSWVCNQPPEKSSKQERWPSKYNWRTPNIKGANTIPVFLDCWWIGGCPHHTDEPPAYDGEQGHFGSQMKRFCLNRHDGYINGLFMDWSVRKVGLKELWALKWHRSFNTSDRWSKTGGVKPEDWPQWMRRFKDY